MVVDPSNRGRWRKPGLNYLPDEIVMVDVDNAEGGPKTDDMNYVTRSLTDHPYSMKDGVLKDDKSTQRGEKTPEADKSGGAVFFFPSSVDVSSATPKKIAPLMASRDSAAGVPSNRNDEMKVLMQEINPGTRSRAQGQTTSKSWRARSTKEVKGSYLHGLHMDPFIYLRGLHLHEDKNVYNTSGVRGGGLAPCLDVAHTPAPDGVGDNGNKVMAKTKDPAGVWRACSSTDNPRDGGKNTANKDFRGADLYKGGHDQGVSDAEGMMTWAQKVQCHSLTP